MSTTASPPTNPTGAFSVGGGDPNRKRRRGLLALIALLAVLAVILAIVLISRSHGSKKSSTPVAAVTTAVTTPAVTPSDTLGSTASGTPTDTVTPSATATTPTAVPPAAAGSGSLVAGATSLLPLATSAGASGDLAKYNGRPVTAKGVRVLSAPADNGFWIGTSKADEVWVQLLLPGLVSPHPVRAGDHVSFHGTMVTNGAGFATTAGVTPAEGAAQLTAQMAHVQVAKNAITFTS